MFNYLALNNNTRHLHIHLIPRYDREVEYLNITFRDEAFGKSYKRNPEFKLSEDLLIKIRDLIKEKVS